MELRFFHTSRSVGHKTCDHSFFFDLFCWENPNKKAEKNMVTSSMTDTSARMKKV